MIAQPKKITPDQIADVIAEQFGHKEMVTCYVGSNAATPTASIEGLTKASGSFINFLPDLGFNLFKVFFCSYGKLLLIFPFTIALA